MQYTKDANSFSLSSKVVIDAICKECDNTTLIEISKTLFCPKCESVYALKLIKIPDKYIPESWIKIARKECKNILNKEK